MNWDDLRYFLELARQKRLSRAGRRLGVDHTTVARRIEQLETDLGCRLFESTAEGYVPTDAGQRLLSHAESVESSVQLLGEEARGQELQAGGTVRIGAPEGFGTAFLMPRMNRLMEDHPELNIELLTLPRLNRLMDDHPDLNIELLTLPRFPNLATREADLIVTLDPPRQGRYIATRLTDFSYGLFASRDYLARHGPVRSRAALAGHRLVGYIDEMLPSPQLNYLDQLMPKHPLRIASSGMLAQLAAVRAGLGLGVLAHYLAQGTGLIALLPREAVWVHTFWLATHADGYRLRRVRVLWDYIRKLVEAESDWFLAKHVRGVPRGAPEPFGGGAG